jgi:hypothetical protein
LNVLVNRIVRDCPSVHSVVISAIYVGRWLRSNWLTSSRELSGVPTSVTEPVLVVPRCVWSRCIVERHYSVYSATFIVATTCIEISCFRRIRCVSDSSVRAYGPLSGREDGRTDVSSEQCVSANARHEEVQVKSTLNIAGCLARDVLLPHRYSSRTRSVRAKFVAIICFPWPFEITNHP